MTRCSAIASSFPSLAVNHYYAAPSWRPFQVSPDAVDRALEQLRSDPRVRYAEQNFVVHADALPNDPFFGRLWGLNNGGQSVGGVPSVPDADIDAPEAWGVTTGSDAVTVAVI